MPEEESNDEFLKRIAGEAGGLSTEVATGLALDAKTAKLLTLGPWGWLGYGAINFGGGVAANWAAQKMRGEEGINYGELISSGLLGIIPFTSLRFAKKAENILGEAGTVRRAVVGGAGMGASDRFIQSGINEGKLPSPTDVAIGTALGGTFGGVLQKSFDEFGKIAARYKDLKNPSEIAYAMSRDPDAQRHMTYWQEQVLKAQESGNTDEIRKAIWNYRKAHDTSGEYSKFTNYEDFVKESEDVVYHLIDEIDGTSDYIRRNDLGEVVQNPLIAEKTRAGAAQVGEKYTTERSEAGTFRRLGLGARRLLLGEVPQIADSDPNLLTGRGSRYQDHHPRPLKTMTAAVDYLTDEGEELSMKWFHDRMGGTFGDLQVPYPAYDIFHYKLHDFLHLEMGPNAGMVRLLEEKHFGTRRLSDGISLQDRITPQPGQTTSFYEDIAHYLEESERIINTFHEALKGQARFSESTPEQYIDRVISIAKLDEEFQDITRRLIERSRSRNPSGGRAPRANVKNIINEIVGTADDELRAAVIYQKNFRRGTPQRKAADKIVYERFQKKFAEVDAYYGPANNIKADRMRDWMEQYEMFGYGFEDEEIEDLMTLLVTQVDDVGIDALPDIGAMSKREILNWMGRDI